MILILMKLLLFCTMTVTVIKKHFGKQQWKKKMMMEMFTFDGVTISMDIWLRQKLLRQRMLGSGFARLHLKNEKRTLMIRGRRRPPPPPP